MKRRWLLAAVAGWLGVSAAAGQVPVGNQATFGRSAPGRSYPFLNRHAYGTTTDMGRPYPFLDRHAYGPTIVSQPQIVQEAGNPVLTTGLNTSPTVPLAPTIPSVFFLDPTAGQFFQSPFFPFAGFNTSSPVISTVSPGVFQSSLFVR